MQRVKDTRSAQAAKRLISYLEHPSEEISDNKSYNMAAIRESIEDGYDFGCEKIIPEIKDVDVMLKIVEEDDPDNKDQTNIVTYVSIGEDTKYYGVSVVLHETFDTLRSKEVKKQTNEVIDYLKEKGVL